MKINNFQAGLLTGVIIWLPYIVQANAPQFKDFNIKQSIGPFAEVLVLNDKQKMFSDKWQQIMQREISNPVNFAGHYRLYLSWNGELPKECGDARWVCGWILDKKTGEVVSTLPEFNGNTAYFSYNDNGTPRPEEFQPIIYPDSTMLWIGGSNIPASGEGDSRCANITYNFKDNRFILIASGECEFDHGDDPYYQK